MSPNTYRPICRIKNAFALISAFILLMGWSTLVTAGQMVNQDIFLQGTYIELGMSAKGWFGSGENAPAGYHPINRLTLGFVADYGKDGWGVAAPGEENQTGDFFLPGGPVQGFAVEWNIAAAERNYQNVNATYQITTNVTQALTSAGTTESATWSGDAVNGAEQLRVFRKISFNTSNTFFIIDVTLTNIGSVTLESVEYLERVDPDNDRDLPGGSFTTENEIVYQTGTDPQNRALVSAKGTVFPNVYLGLAAVDARAKVAYGGISSDADNIFTADLAQGSTNTADENIGLAFRFGDLAPGQSVTFRYGYLLVGADIDNFVAAITTTTTTNGVDLSTGAGGGCFISESHH